MRAGQAPLYVFLRAGCAAALQEGLFTSSGGAVIAAEDGRPEVEDGEDERAALVLQLLLGSLDGQAPTLAHMLLGFDVEDGPEGAALLAAMLAIQPMRMHLQLNFHVQGFRVRCRKLFEVRGMCEDESNCVAHGRCL